MITEIEMLKKRIEFLERTLMDFIGRFDGSPCNYAGDLWTEMYDKLKEYEEEYKNVARIGCRECMENEK